jgi:hypothetical protein
VEQGRVDTCLITDILHGGFGKGLFEEAPIERIQDFLASLLFDRFSSHG